MPRLSADDVVRVEKLAHDPERQQLWRASRIATRIVIERAAGRAYRNIDFAIARNGRPYLGEGPPYFNVSHSGDAALIAVSNAVPIGIDLEEVRGLTMTEDRRRRVIAAAARLANGQPARRTPTRTGTSFKPGFAWRLRPRRLEPASGNC